MSWIMLAAAGLLEVVWAIAMKHSDGLTRPLETSIFVVAAVASFWLLAQALRDLPVGTGYAVWTGIGAIGAATVGIVFLSEAVNPARLASLGLVAIGIVGLALSSTTH
ncbi:DMT family transporter [Patulibacter defluvii]|uniref:DMT family transporter n=1 Tax=Patulibacter defluvii TaxID=3095358 RepID=UPI002A756FAE|nr:multidrug efflux SMR transporter [Patulibacter sp. DM4]